VPNVPGMLPDLTAPTPPGILVKRRIAKVLLVDDLDRRLLEIVQGDFPIAERPYRVLGECLGISERNALDRVRALANSGIIREIGPSFDARRLEHVTTLVAAKVPADRLDEAANSISAFAQVTHNYGRDHEYNLWFTLVCRDAEELERTLEEIKTKTGISDIHELPAERTFKLRVNLGF